MKVLLTGAAGFIGMKRDVGFEPRTLLAVGIARWAEWYRAIRPPETAHPCA